MSENVLHVENVTMQFGGLKAINDLNMSVEKGEIHGLLGPNGSGKTTCFNVISGVYQPTVGEVLLEGQKISGLRLTMNFPWCAEMVQNAQPPKQPR